jgi:hypothetical protein
MMGQGSAEAPGAVEQSVFATTHWSVALAAANRAAYEVPGLGVERAVRLSWPTTGQNFTPQPATDSKGFYRLIQPP